jgi:hypothetical protein
MDLIVQRFQDLHQFLIFGFPIRKQLEQAVLTLPD